MKISTQKLLLFLTITQDGVDERGVFEDLWPELTPGGRRSLIHYLQAKEFIREEWRAERKRILLTEFGRSQLKVLFPALFLTSSAMYGLVIIRPDAPAEFLRRAQKYFVLTTRQISPRVFLTAWGNDKKWLDEFREEGIRWLIYVPWSENGIGDISFVYQILAEKDDLDVVLSGISSESRRLIDDFSSKEWSYHQQKKNFISLFHRFFSACAETKNLAQLEVSQVESAKAILANLSTVGQKLFACGNSRNFSPKELQ